MIARVLGLSVYRLKIRAASPLPKRFTSSAGKAPAYSFFYPAEDTRLMACKSIALGMRMLWGVLAREGLRCGEALALRVRDIDLERGSISLDRNKTDDARTWALDPGVVRALTKWLKLREALPNDLVFIEANEGAVNSSAWPRGFETTAKRCTRRA